MDGILLGGQRNIDMIYCQHCSLPTRQYYTRTDQSSW